MMPVQFIPRILASACCVVFIAGAVNSTKTLADESESSAPVVFNLGEDELPSVGYARQVAGPRSPEFPDLDTQNHAIKLNGKGSRIVIQQDAAQTADARSLQFVGGDAITIAAWISPRKGTGGGHRYIVGKGRTGAKGFRTGNQNWALRITPKSNLGMLGFLFASADGPKDVHWHRWTSKNSFPIGDGWHHVVVTYRFGEPETIRSWIDGVPSDGTWDMGGPTTDNPIVDDDQVWIGSSMNGSPGNSFIGSLDSVSIERQLVDDDEIAKRYRRDDSIPRVVRVNKPVMPVFDSIPQGKVTFQIIEELPIEHVWPDQEDLASLPVATVPGATWHGDSFLLPRLPMRFDSWGIRSDWKSPALLRVAADVQLPTGQLRFLLRARSLGRLWIDGKLVAQTKAQTEKAPSGEEPITPLTSPPHPGVRVKGYRQQEVIVEHEIKGDQATKTCRIVLELAVGGAQVRTETGEVCVAIETADEESFDVLVPIGGQLSRLSLSDPAAANELGRAGKYIQSLDVHDRRTLAASQDAFWENRHAIASHWAAENPPPEIPDSGNKSTHPIDAFLQRRINEAKESLIASSDSDPLDDPLNETILPILSQHCLRCHGKAVKGGLRLDSLASSLAGGESGWAAVVPGKPDESELILRLQTDDPSTRMPLGGDGPSEGEIQSIVDWIRDGALWPEKAIAPKSLEQSQSISDAAFLRRVSLDTIGLPPTESEAVAFLSDSSPDKRNRLIDRRLDDVRVADHLVADWLDLLAENPTLLNTSLNSTGPFRFFLHDALVDRKPIDRMISELIMMRGDRHTGGSSGFGVAGENDSPLAAKAHILASGLLGIDLQCARCHDSPFHSTTQEDLFSIAAMLNRKPLTVPDTSRVPDAFFEEQQRDSMIEVTLAKGHSVDPKWSLARYTGVENNDSIDVLLHSPTDSRDRLAALITSPANRRFSAVIVNRIWTRLIGAGLVPSLHDWEHHVPSHPDLLQWLSHQFIDSGYDVRQLMRLIMTSDVYGRQSIDPTDGNDAEMQFFAAPITRRLTAEQVVDSMLASTGRAMDCEEMTFVHDGRRPLSNRLTLGVPERAWMMATLNNERDRPSLSLPKARKIVDVLQAFGWSGSRQKPIHNRESESNVLQPGVLANGVFSASLARASLDSPLANLAVDAKSPESLIDSLFLRILTRYPNDLERKFFVSQLTDQFQTRVIPIDARSQSESVNPLPLVHWFNHLQPEANEIQQELERRVRQGPPVDPRLQPDWRTRYEDVVWSLINHDEFVWIP